MDSAPFALLGLSSKLIGCTLFTKEDGKLHDEDLHAKLDGTSVAALHQVHGAKSVIVRAPVARTIQADALATDYPNLIVEIRTADCQSFLVYAPQRHVVGLIHAGWKGLLAGVIPSFFDMLWEEWQIHAQDTIVCAGPSLCLRCSSFTDPRKELPGIRKEFFHGNLVDLRGIAEDQLFALGVREDRFERHADCTRCSPQTYWTYRGGDRDAVNKGMTNILATVLRPAV